MYEQEQLRIDGNVRLSHYKKEASTVYGEYKGQQVVVKRGGAEVFREAAILQRVEHQSFARVLEIGTDGPSNILILNRLSGVPLDTFIDLDLDNYAWHSRQLQLAETVQLVDRLATCFAALKDAGYLYRDLNLNHVLVDTETVHLVDVEWSVPVNDEGAAIVDNEAGTWETMSPEEFDVGGQMTEASTVYTLGTVVVQLLTGSNPFHVDRNLIPDADKRRHETRLLHADLPYVDTDNETIRVFLLRCLEPVSTDRYQTIEEFRTALRSLQ